SGKEHGTQHWEVAAVVSASLGIGLAWWLLTGRLAGALTVAGALLIIVVSVRRSRRVRTGERLRAVDLAMGQPFSRRVGLHLGIASTIAGFVAVLWVFGKAPLGMRIVGSLGSDLLLGVVLFSLYYEWSMRKPSE